MHPALPQNFPPLKSLRFYPSNLPQQLSSFIGREKEIMKVQSLLASIRLLTLTGSGGCGKTRLALQVAAGLLEEYGDGVWLVELAALTDASLIVSTTANVLGVREEAGKPLLQSLTEYTRSRTMLLLLDNCEHLIQPCAHLVGTLLRNCPHLTILATSREALNVDGEH